MRTIATDSCVVVEFDASASPNVTLYTATAQPGGIQSSSSESPLTLSILANGTAYSITVTATNSGAQTSVASGAVVETPVSLGNVRHFGFHSVGTNPAVHGNRVALVDACTTANHVFGTDIGGQPVYLQEMATLGNGQQGIVDIRFQFFSYPDLRADWAVQWDFLKTQIASYMPQVLCWYLDEPVHNTVTAGGTIAQAEANLAFVASVVKADFPNVPLLVVYAWPQVTPTMNIPATIDWVGFDRYTEPWNTTIPPLLATIKTRVLAHQRLWLVPQAFQQLPGTAQSDALQAANMDLYWNLARGDPDIIGVLVFLISWMAPGQAGALELPLTYARAQEIGKQVKHSCAPVVVP